MLNGAYNIRITENYSKEIKWKTQKQNRVLIGKFCTQYACYVDSICSILEYTR